MKHVWIVWWYEKIYGAFDSYELAIKAIRDKHQSEYAAIGERGDIGTEVVVTAYDSRGVWIKMWMIQKMEINNGLR